VAYVASGTFLHSLHQNSSIFFSLLQTTESAHPRIKCYSTTSWPPFSLFFGRSYRYLGPTLTALICLTVSFSCTFFTPGIASASFSIMVNPVGLRLPYVKHHNHSTSSLERHRLEELSIPSRAKLPVFLVGEHTASLFPPFEFDLAQQDNREENINRSRSRTGSLTSHIYEDLPLSPICGTVPTTFVYDEHPLVSPRPALGPSMKTWPQMNGADALPSQSMDTSQQFTRASAMSEKLLPLHYEQLQQNSAFSDSSSEYSQKSPLSDPNNRSSWTSLRGKSWAAYRTNLMEGGQLSPTSQPAAYILHQQFPDTNITGAISEGLELRKPRAIQPRRPAPPEVRSSEQITSVYDMLNTRPSDFGIEQPTQPSQEGDPITNRNQSKSQTSREMADSTKQYQQLTIRTRPSTKRSKVHFSPTIQRKANSFLEGARESFARGVDEISSPVTSRSSQTSFHSPTSSDYQGSPTPTANTPLTPFPNFHSTSQPQFFPDSSPIPGNSEADDKPSALVSPKVPRYRKFGWATGKHPLKSPHPDHKGNSKTMTYSAAEEESVDTASTKDNGVLSIIANTTMRIAGLSSSRNEKRRKTNGLIITNHQRTYQGPATPFPLSANESGSYGNMILSPATENGVAAGIASTLRGVAGWKTKEEKREREEKNLQAEKEERRREILSRGIKLAGEPTKNTGPMDIEELPYVTPTSVPKPPVDTEMRGALYESPPSSAVTIKPGIGGLGASSPATPGSFTSRFGPIGEPLPSSTDGFDRGNASGDGSNFNFSPGVSPTIAPNHDGTEWL
jgi:hypothetical protein